MSLNVLPGDRQRLLVLDAAYEVANLVDWLTHAVEQKESQGLPVPRELNDDLVEATERMVNLLSLIHFHSDSGQEETKQTLQSGLDDLRKRFVQTARSIAASRSRGIIRRANVVLSGKGDYVMGIAERLALSMHEIETFVHALGGEALLDEVGAQTLGEARARVTQLQALEKRLGGYANLEDFAEGSDTPSEDAS